MSIAETAKIEFGSGPEKHSGSGRTFLTCVGIVASILLIYGQSVRFEFVSFDDYHHLQQNPHVVTGLSFDNLVWDFEIHGPRHWHPLTWLSHQADFALFGKNAGLHHAGNVFLHAAASILLFLALQQMTGAWGASAFSAFAFAVHPLNVESVAWVAERSNVLCGTFWMASLWAYARYVRRPNWHSYLAVAGCHAAALMSKPLAMTLPCVLLLLDYWPLRRLQKGCPPGVIHSQESQSGDDRSIWKIAAGLVLEKTPLLALSLGTGALAVLCQQAAEAMAPLTHLPLSARFATSIAGYGWYLEHAVYPARLVCFYPHPSFIDANLWEVLAVRCALSGLVLVLLSAVAVRYRRDRPWLLVGWLWFLGVLVPMIGLVQIGAQQQADRYAYIPLIGLFLAVAWTGGHRLIPLGWVVLGAWGVAAWHQTGAWHDSLSLYSHVVATDERNHWGHSNLGVEMVKHGKTREAVEHLQQAVNLVPRYPLGHYNLGVALEDLGNTDLAISHFETSLSQNSENAKAHERLAAALARRGELDRAIFHFQEAARVSPDYAPAFYNLGLALARAGRHREASVALQKSRELQPGSLSTLFALAYVLRNAGDDAAARAALESLLTVKPNADEAWLMLGDIFRDEGKPVEARRCYHDALRWHPNWQQALDALDKLPD